MSSCTCAMVDQLMLWKSMGDMSIWRKYVKIMAQNCFVTMASVSWSEIKGRLSTTTTPMGSSSWLVAAGGGVFLESQMWGLCALNFLKASQSHAPQQMKIMFMIQLACRFKVTLILRSNCWYTLNIQEIQQCQIPYKQPYANYHPDGSAW